jgi:N-acetylglucosamine-6-phosphate deacetylase
MTGLGHQAGKLAVGQPANLVAVDAAGQLVLSIVNGTVFDLAC